MDLSNTALLTHKTCLDGSVCALVFVAAGGKLENVRFSGPHHDETDEKFIDLCSNWGGPIIVADLSVSEAAIDKVLFGFNDIYLLDHHTSALGLAKYGWCEIEAENKRCGSKMLFDFLRRKIWNKEVKLNNLNNFLAYKEIVDIADDVDRWVWNIPESKNIASLHGVLGQNLFVKRFLKNSSTKLTQFEQNYQEIENARVQDRINKAKQEVLKVNKVVGEKSYSIGYVFVGFEKSTDRSLLAEALYTDVKLDLDVVVLIGKSSISLRKKKDCDLDLSRVAELNRGGGHSAAAGCKLSDVLGFDVVDLVSKQLKLE